MWFNLCFSLFLYACIALLFTIVLSSYINNVWGIIIMQIRLNKGPGQRHSLFTPKRIFDAVNDFSYKMVPDYHMALASFLFLCFAIESMFRRRDAVIVSSKYRISSNNSRPSINRLPRIIAPPPLNPSCLLLFLLSASCRDKV